MRSDKAFTDDFGFIGHGKRNHKQALVGKRMHARGEHLWLVICELAVRKIISKIQFRKISEQYCKSDDRPATFVGAANRIIKEYGKYLPARVQKEYKDNMPPVFCK